MKIAYSPAALAERWECSEQKVRNMIASGSLPAFRLDGKLWRIRAKDVEDFECNGGSQSLEANTASPGMTEQSRASADVIDLAQQTAERLPAAHRLSLRNSRVLPARG